MVQIKNQIYYIISEPKLLKKQFDKQILRKNGETSQYIRFKRDLTRLQQYNSLTQYLNLRVFFSETSKAFVGQYTLYQCYSEPLLTIYQLVLKYLLIIQ